MIHHNNFIGNGINAYDTGVNIWNSSIGNYWDDYNGIDGNGDGIGELPYYIGDYMPLMYPIETIPLFVWVDDNYTPDTPGWGVDHFSNLQEAIDSLRENGGCYVYSGIYQGCNLYKSITLIGEKGTNIQSIDDGLFVTADNVKIKGFRIKAAKNGIKIQEVENVSIEDCYIYESVFGLYMVNTHSCKILNSGFCFNVKGIYLFNATNTLISHNKICDNSYFGIEISHNSCNNQISDCQIENNGEYGVYITQNSNDNRIYHNNFINNTAYDSCENEWSSIYEYVLGNYWSDYESHDIYHGKNLNIEGKDGIGDTPYFIAGGGVDEYPLMNEINLFGKELSEEELSHKWALICVSTNNLDFDDWDQYQFKETQKQPIDGLAWQKFIPSCNFIYYIIFSLETPSGAGLINISIRTDPIASSTSIFNFTFQPSTGFYYYFLSVNISVNPGNSYYFVVECNPLDRYNMSGAVAPIYTNGGESNLNNTIPGWNWYFGVYGRFSDTDGFPAQGLQAYYILKAHGYRDDHIIFMLWYNNDSYISIYGGHNDLFGPPQQIGGPNGLPEIDYDHNSSLPPGIDNWYELLEYNINWLANNVGPQDDVLIYLINHGFYDNATGKAMFCFEDGSPDLSEDVFDSWIDNINCKRMIILIDTCYSGDFIDAPGNVGFDSGIDDETNRILVSASGHCPAWYWISASRYHWAGSLFFHPFFEKINEGKSVREAYEYALSYMPLQNPQITDNIGDVNKYSFVKNLFPNFVWVNQIFNSTFPGWELDHFASIGKGVKEVIDGGGCFVFSGIFKENLVIDKEIYISGMQSNQTIVKGNGLSAFTITGNDVEIHLFGIKDCWNDAGVNIFGNNVTISSCSIYDNYYGVYINATNSTIEKSNVYDNSFIGILAEYTQQSKIGNCNIFGNNNGMILDYSDYNYIEKNKFLDNYVNALKILHSNNNIIYHNDFENNFCGCYLDSSSDNLFYFNNFIGNKEHVIDYNANAWDNGSVGNYWDDYNGIDENHDGIGDTPYIIDTDSIDYYPLIKKAGYPIAYFDYSPSYPYTYEQVYFYDASIDLDGYIVSWHWDFGDGGSSNEENPTHSYADNGIYMVNLTIVDNDGMTASIEKQIVILNTPPYPDFIWQPEEARDIDEIIFNASSSYDIDGSIVNYTWDFGDGSKAYGVIAKHVYEDDGTYSINLTIKDDDGAIAYITKEIVVKNVPPTADFRFSPEEPTDLDTIIFSDESIDLDGNIVNYTWTFGDGNVSHSKNPTHKYADNGLYLVSLTIKDDDGAIAYISKAILVKNIPPVANFSYEPKNPTDLQTIKFTSNSYDLDGVIVNYTWNFGNGNVSYEKNATWKYSDDGIYMATLTVVDDDGSSASITIKINVTNVPPTATFSSKPTKPRQDEKVIFNASASYDPDGSIVNYTWDFESDGIVDAYGLIVEHKYNKKGNYLVTLTVVDDDGAKDSYQMLITVREKERVPGFEFIIILAASAILIFMKKYRKGIWRI